MILMLSLALLLCTTAVAHALGFQQVVVPDADNTPRYVGIWYPSEAATASHPLGAHRHTVAVNGAIAGSQLPLVVILHGDQSSFENHYGSAGALAEAGFVAIGISQDMTLAARPRHVGRVLDYLFTAWPGHERLDPSRVGIFGFSV